MRGTPKRNMVTTRQGPGGRVISFGHYRLDRVAGRLHRGDVELPMRAKSFALLR
jgi:DNA-binding response OmpR family regulator